MFNKSDNGDLFTEDTFEVMDVDKESQPGLSIGFGTAHKGLSSDCVPSVLLLSDNGVDIGDSELLGVDEELVYPLVLGLYMKDYLQMVYHQ